MKGVLFNIMLHHNRSLCYTNVVLNSYTDLLGKAGTRNVFIGRGKVG